jgi:hypothetical protein
VLVPFTLTAASATPDVAPLRHWSAPLYYKLSSTNAAAASASATAPLAYVAIPPCRLADTRVGSGYSALGSSPLAALTPVTLPIAGSCLTPASPVPLAYSLSVSVVPVAPTPGGYLTAYPDPINPAPLAASLTWNPGAVLGTDGVIVESSPDGSINILVRFPADVVVDINGYYVTQPGRTASLVFNASAMSAFPGEAASTLTQTLGNSAIGIFPITAWGLQPSSVINLMLTSNVPANFTSGSPSPVVRLHFLTVPASNISGTVNLNLLVCSVPAAANISGACFTIYTGSIAVSDAVPVSSGFTFNHYDVSYNIGNYSINGHAISAGDVLALTIDRIADTFGDSIYLTSAEFTYATN